MREVNSGFDFTVLPRNVKLTTRSGTEVRRTIPSKELRTIGAWCFVDHFGPISGQDAMKVASHPHTGLQTATWLFEGSVEHNDSVGSRQVIRPGELNLMTAGSGISHSELSVSAGKLSGIQLWIALPDEFRHMSPNFQNHSDLPKFEIDTCQFRLFVGELFEHKSSAKVFSPLLGVEISVPAGGKATVPLDPKFEYGILLTAGDVEINEVPTAFGELRYLHPGASSLEISSSTGACVILLGGEPFTEEIVMWWNFIARSHSEIEILRNDWQLGSARFGNVLDSIGERIPAPPLPNVKLKPNGISKRG